MNRSKLNSSTMRLTTIALQLLLLLAIGYAPTARATPPFLLVVYVSGGWDVSMVFDGKLDQSTVHSQSGQTKASLASGLSYVAHSDRPAVQSFFTEHGERSVIVNGLFVGGMDQWSAQKQLLTVVPTGKTRPVDWATLYADASGFSGDLPHVVFAAPFAPGEYLGQATHLTQESISEYQSAVPNSLEFASSAEEALKAMRSAAMVKVSDGITTGSLDFDKLTALAKGHANEAKIATQLKAAVKTVGDQGGSDQFTYQAKIALELFHQGASIAATVQAGNSGAWATIRDHFSRQSAAFQTLFTDLSTVLAYAKTLGLSDQLTVVVMSEGGRAPLLNAEAGKGPWPYTSMLLWGTGINGGQVIGLSDDYLRGVPIDPIFGGSGKSTSVLLTPANVWSALYTKAGFSTSALIGDTAPLAQVIK